MGFLSGIKDITGVGLNADEQYDRAYKKGIFLQPPNYEAASNFFYKAFEKYYKDGNRQMAARARTNSLIYKVIAHKDHNILNQILMALNDIQEIERIGSQKEMIDVNILKQELQAYQLEKKAEVNSDPNQKTADLKMSSDLYFNIGNEELTFVKILGADGPTEKAAIRGYYTSAKGDYYEALSFLETSPNDALNNMQKAHAGFTRSKAQKWMECTETYIDNISVKRKCWICDREVQGKDIFFKYYPADIKPYHKKMVEENKQDPQMLEVEGKLTICTACGTMIERQADNYAKKRANEVWKWASSKFAQHDSEIASLKAAIYRLESISMNSNY